MSPRDMHRLFLGSKFQPTKLQEECYALQELRGFFACGEDEERTDLAIFIALAQAIDDNRKYQDVVLFVPKELQGWVLKRIKHIAVTATQRVEPVLKTEKGQAAMTHLKNLLQHLRLGMLETWPVSPPERWAAYGMPEDVALPLWLSDYILPVERIKA